VATASSLPPADGPPEHTHRWTFTTLDRIRSTESRQPEAVGKDAVTLPKRTVLGISVGVIGLSWIHQSLGSIGLRPKVTERSPT